MSFLRIACMSCALLTALVVLPALSMGQTTDTPEEGSEFSPATPEPETSSPPSEATEATVPPDRQDGRQQAAAIAAASFMNIPGLFDRGIEPGFWVEGGIARVNRRAVGSARAMLGVTAALDPHFLTLGPVVDYSSLDGFAVGGGLDYLATAPGVFLTAAVLANPGDGTVLSGTAGWQLFAVDVQRHLGQEDPHTVIFFKLRVPVSYIVRSVIQ